MTRGIDIRGYTIYVDPWSQKDVDQKSKIYFREMLTDFGPTSFVPIFGVLAIQVPST